MRRHSLAPLLIALLVFAWIFPSMATAQDTTFTYQGELLVDGTAFSGRFDFIFLLFDDVLAGGQIGPAVLVEDVAVDNGLFTVDLDFGQIFDGTPLWLEIQLQEAGGPGPFAALDPRQPLTSAPGALFANEATDADTVDGRDATDLVIQSVNLNGTTLEITAGGVLFTQDLAAVAATDNDTDATNERNTGLVLNGTDLELTDAGGTLSADLSSLQDGVDDADNDPLNEVITSATLAGNILELIEGGTVTNLADLTALINAALAFDGTNLTLTDGGGTLSVDLSPLLDGVTDADADPANELNTSFTFDGTNLDLTDAGGTLSVDLTALPINDGDADPANELITAGNLTNNNNDTLALVEGGITNTVDVSALQNTALTFDGTNVQLSDGGGTLSADLSSLVDDADANPANELNTGLVLNGTDLEVTDAGGTLTADLSPILDDDPDADPTNELITSAIITNSTATNFNDSLEIVEGGITNTVDVTALQNSALTFDGTNISVTDGGGTLSTDLSSLVDDADANPANELNTAFILNGTDLELTDAGGTLSVDLSALPINDADADPTNELITSAVLTNSTATNFNDTLEIVEGGITNLVDVTALQNSALTFDGTNILLTDAAGTLSEDLSPLINDADADPANELNTGFVLNGTDLELTDAGGTLTVDLSTIQDGVNDADADPANELIDAVLLTNTNILRIVEAGQTNDVDVSTLQNLNFILTGASLQATDGGGTLAADLSDLDDDNLSLTLSTTTLSVTDSAGTLNVDLSPIDGVNDLDTVTTNETITSAILNGSEVLEIVEAGNTNSVDLSTLSVQPTALYDNFGWTGTSAADGTGASGTASQKVLEIVETATANRFEVDFNDLVPGTIITNAGFTINDPGLYYLTGNLTNTGSGNGITIATSNVTLDLMGYTLFGGKISGILSDDGILVSGSETNIVVRNGGVVGWDATGVDGALSKSATYSDLHVRMNNIGLTSGENSLLVRVTAALNDSDGIQADGGTAVFQCTTSVNGGDGFELAEGCAIANSAAFDNEGDGFNVNNGGMVDACAAYFNSGKGFDLATGGQLINSTAYDNGSNGFEITSGTLRSSIAYNNAGHGILALANSTIVGNNAHENDLAGIHVPQSDCYIEGNQLTDNDTAGIDVLVGGNLIIRNAAAGNLTNFNVVTNAAFGPILSVTNAGDLSGISAADHPWANFDY